MYIFTDFPGMLDRVSIYHYWEDTYATGLRKKFHTWYREISHNDRADQNNIAKCDAYVGLTTPLSTFM